MTTYHNCYAFDRLGQRVVIDMGLPHHEAVQRCEYEATFIESMGDTLTRFGDTWYADGLIPRVVMYQVKFDPFHGNVSRAVWLPNSAEL